MLFLKKKFFSLRRHTESQHLHRSYPSPDYHNSSLDSCNSLLAGLPASTLFCYSLMHQIIRSVPSRLVTFLTQLIWSLCCVLNMPSTPLIKTFSLAVSSSWNALPSEASMAGSFHSVLVLAQCHLPTETFLDHPIFKCIPWHFIFLPCFIFTMTYIPF